MLLTDIGRLEILCRERFKTVPYRCMLQRRRGAFFSSPLKIHLSLDISILDISLTSGGLLEKAARIELI
jgi:hypothetical protein